MQPRVKKGQLSRKDLPKVLESCGECQALPPTGRFEHSSSIAFCLQLSQEARQGAAAFSQLPQAEGCLCHPLRGPRAFGEIPFSVFPEVAQGSGKACALDSAAPGSLCGLHGDCLQSAGHFFPRPAPPLFKKKNRRGRG